MSDNGIARPVVGITPDEATFNTLFANGDALFAMHRYNDLPLARGSIVGAWGTSSTSAGTSPSALTGISVSSHVIDVSFAANGNYHFVESAHVDTKGQKVIEDGAFSAGDGFYNSRRRHSHLGNINPIEFELKSPIAMVAA